MQCECDLGAVPLDLEYICLLCCSTLYWKCQNPAGSNLIAISFLRSTIHEFGLSPPDRAQLLSRQTSQALHAGQGSCQGHCQR